jgi:hypothetical protein
MNIEGGEAVFRDAQPNAAADGAADPLMAAEDLLSPGQHPGIEVPRNPVRLNAEWSLFANHS